jgi:hypothetical protein
LTICVRISSQHHIPSAALAVAFTTLSGTKIHSGWTREAGFPISLEPGIQRFQCRFRNVRFRPGQRMKIVLWLEAGTVVDYLEDAFTLEIVDGHETGWHSTDRSQGVVLCDYEWSSVKDDTASRGSELGVTRSGEARLL